MFSQSVPLSGRVISLRECFPENNKSPLEKQRYRTPPPAITTSRDPRAPPIERPTRFVNACFCTRPTLDSSLSATLKRPRPLSTAISCGGQVGCRRSTDISPPRAASWRAVPRVGIEHRGLPGGLKPKPALSPQPAHRRISSGSTSVIGSSVAQPDYGSGKPNLGEIGGADGKRAIGAAAFPEKRPAPICCLQ